MESVFEWPSARTRHKEAPLLREREQYLSHLVSQGISHERVRSVASTLLQVIRLLELTDFRSVDLSEIEGAGRRWATDKASHRTRQPGKSTARAFSSVADGEVTIPAFNPTPEGVYQVDAFRQRFSKAVGFFIVPTPNEHEPSPGTGLLVQFRGEKYLVSALHNFFYDEGGKDQVGRSWESTRFKFRDEAAIERVESLNEAARRVKSEYGIKLPLSLPEGLLIDAAHDLIAVRMNDSLKDFMHAEFVDLESECFTKELTTGTSLLMAGVTLSSQVNAPGAGPTLIPQLDHVRFDPNVETSGIAQRWRSSEYFFMPYSLKQDGFTPHGFSGAPVFVNKEPCSGELWKASPHVVGIALRYFPKRDLLLAVKISTVIDLLKRQHDESRLVSDSDQSA